MAEVVKYEVVFETGQNIIGLVITFLPPLQLDVLLYATLSLLKLDFLLYHKFDTK